MLNPGALLTMPLKAVRIEAMDMNGDPVMAVDAKGKPTGAVVASGFLMREGTSIYLYTCWHVVSGIDPSTPALPGAFRSQRRMALRISMQAVEERRPGFIWTGGTQIVEVSLYDTSITPPLPLWEQDQKSVPNEELIHSNLRVPLWHDAVRILMPASLRASEAQLLTEADIFSTPPLPGDLLFVVGYPYGYSSLEDTPTAIVLTRSVAAVARDGPRREVLMDGGGTPGMSGGPVFYLKRETLYLLGLYTGILYPDAAPNVVPERTTALGTVCPLDRLPYDRLARPERKRLRDIRR